MMTKEIVIERYGAAPVHDGQRRLGGVDAAAPARRELPGPARRAHHEPGLPRPLGPGARLARLPRPMPLLLADEPAHEPRATRQRRRTRCSRRRARGSRCAAATPRTRTTSAGRRSSCSAPTGPSSCPHPDVACGLPDRADLEPATNPTGERCGIFDFMRSVFGVRITPDAPNGKGRSATDNVGVQYGLNALLARTDHAGAVRRPERQGRRHRHRRQLHAGAQGSRPGRAGDPLQHRPHEQRLRRGRHPGDRRPHRRPDGRHGLPPGVRVVRLPRAARPVERHTTTTRSCGCRGPAASSRSSSTSCGSGSTTSPPTRAATGNRSRSGARSPPTSATRASWQAASRAT